MKTTEKKELSYYRLRLTAYLNIIIRIECLMKTSLMNELI